MWNIHHPQAASAASASNQGSKARHAPRRLRGEAAAGTRLDAASPGGGTGDGGVMRESFRRGGGGVLGGRGGILVQGLDVVELEVAHHVLEELGLPVGQVAAGLGFEHVEHVDGGLGGLEVLLDLVREGVHGLAEVLHGAGGEREDESLEEFFVAAGCAHGKTFRGRDQK